MIDLEKLNTDYNQLVCIAGKNYYCKCKSSIEAWDNCNHPDWLIWGATRLNVNRKLVGLATAKALLSTFEVFDKYSRSGNVLYVDIQRALTDFVLYCEDKMSYAGLSNLKHEFKESCKLVMYDSLSITNAVRLCLNGEYEEALFRGLSAYGVKVYKIKREDMELNVLDYANRGNRGQFMLLYGIYGTYDSNDRIEINHNYLNNFTDNETKAKSDQMCNIIREVISKEEIQTKIKNF